MPLDALESRETGAGTVIRRVLIGTARFANFAGSEILAIEIAEHFRSRGAAVTLASFYVGRRLRDLCAAAGIDCVDLVREELPHKQFDVAWLQHGVVANFLICNRQVTARKIISISLSHFEPLETPPFLNIPVSTYLVHSHENYEFFVEKYPDYKDRVSIFPNSAPRPFFAAARRAPSTALRRLAVVSNHPPAELLQATRLLRKRGLQVDRYGTGGKEVRITADILARYDAVVTIGKTVQYCFASRVPVFCYDFYGGPGWLGPDNVERAGRKNFSGRCEPRRLSAADLARSIIEGYPEAAGHADALHGLARASFDLDRNLASLLETLPDTAAGDMRTTESCIIRNYGEIISRTIAFEARFHGIYQKLTNGFLPFKAALALVKFLRRVAPVGRGRKLAKI